MRTDAHLTSVLAVCLTFAGITANAHAAAIDGGVQWAFSGTVISVPSSLNTSGCCDLAYSVGQIVTGSIVLTEAPAPPMTIGSVQLDVPGAAQEVFAEVNPPRQDGTGGSPDTLSIFNILSHSGTGILRLSPGWTVFEADGTLSLIAPSGNAWNGINPRTGDILPDAPPDPALLTTREIDLNLFALSPAGAQVGGHVLIRIDAFPEPGAAALIFATLVGLGAARRSARLG